jgi:hypothetical protein
LYNPLKQRLLTTLEKRCSSKGSVKRFLEIGGAKRDRTADLFNAIEALSQLSYGPILIGKAWEALPRISFCSPRMNRKYERFGRAIFQNNFGLVRRYGALLKVQPAQLTLSCLTALLYSPACAAVQVPFQRGNCDRAVFWPDTPFFSMKEKIFCPVRE